MAGATASPPKTLDFLRRAYQIYISKGVRRDLIFPALRLLTSYLMKRGPCRETEALCAAALYLAFRHPNTYPNPVPRSYFALQSHRSTKRRPANPIFDGPFNAKETSIDWYVKRIVDRLGIIVLYDDRGRPYFLEREGPIYQLIRALTSETVMDAALSATVEKQQDLLEAVVMELLDRILGTLRLLPEVFRQSLYEHLAPHVKDLMSSSMRMLGV